MAARHTQRTDETTVLDLLMKGDYAGLAKLTGVTVDQLERMLDGSDDPYDALDDDDEDGEDGEEDGDDEDGDGLA